MSLLEQHKELQEIADQRKETNIEKMRREEDRILQVTFQFNRVLEQKRLILVLQFFKKIIWDQVVEPVN